MERKTGHSEEEVKRILKEAEERKIAAEANPQPPISQEEAVAAIIKAGAGAIEEYEEHYKEDLEKEE